MISPQPQREQRDPQIEKNQPVEQSKREPFLTGVVPGAWAGYNLLTAEEATELQEAATRLGMTHVEQTALTSRNITGGYVMNVLTGYISLQTEHHLFPMMPTANLDKAQPLVRDFFKKHGLPYGDLPYWTACYYTWKNLYDVGQVPSATKKID